MSYGMGHRHSVTIWCIDCRNWHGEYVSVVEDVARKQADDGYRNHKKTCTASEATL